MTDVGWLTVVASIVEVDADSSDPDLAPDTSWPDGTVTLAPVGLSHPYLIHGVNGQIDGFEIPRTVTCRLVAGVLYPPDNLDSETGVRVLAPLQECFDELDWHWRATFKLSDGSTWPVEFTGAAGDTVNLAQVAYLSNLQSPSPVPQSWVQGVGEGTPDGMQPGQYLVDLNTSELYLVGV